MVDAGCSHRSSLNAVIGSKVPGVVTDSVHIHTGTTGTAPTGQKPPGEPDNEFALNFGGEQKVVCRSVIDTLHWGSLLQDAFSTSFYSHLKQQVRIVRMYCTQACICGQRVWCKTDGLLLLFVAEATEVLRQDLPFLFVRDPRFHIFVDNLTFR